MFWRLVDSQAQLSCGSLEAWIDLSAPSLGLTELKWNGVSADWRLLQISPLNAQDASRKLIDRYVRCGDLIATFERQPPSTVSPQVNWRVTSDAEFKSIGIELIVSMQTDLLDSSPYSRVVSSCPGTTLLVADDLRSSAFRDPSDGWKPGFVLFLFRSERLGVSYAECIHPDDYVLVECHVSKPGKHSHYAHWWLFNERLEKGVIRRARICGWFMPAENDLETAVELARRFVAEPPPLTT